MVSPLSTLFPPRASSGATNTIRGKARFPRVFRGFFLSLAPVPADRCRIGRPARYNDWRSLTSRFVGWDFRPGFSTAERRQDTQPTNVLEGQRSVRATWYLHAFKESCHMEEQATPACRGFGRVRRPLEPLVSTTNWEKGRIIAEWREALRAGRRPGRQVIPTTPGAAQVGNVTPQHVGRLRRVFERFGDVMSNTAGYTGAIFRRPSTGPTRKCTSKAPCRTAGRSPRCATSVGRPSAASRSRSRATADIVTAEVDEDVSAADDGSLPATISESFGEVHDAGRLFRRRARRHSRSTPTRPCIGGPSPRRPTPGRPLLRPFETPAALAVGPERGIRADEIGDSQPQGLRLARDRPRRRACPSWNRSGNWPWPRRNRRSDHKGTKARRGRSPRPSSLCLHAFVVVAENPLAGGCSTIIGSCFGNHGRLLHRHRGRPVSTPFGGCSTGSLFGSRRRLAVGRGRPSCADRIAAGRRRSASAPCRSSWRR